MVVKVGRVVMVGKIAKVKDVVPFMVIYFRPRGGSADSSLLRGAKQP